MPFYAKFKKKKQKDSPQKKNWSNSYTIQQNLISDANENIQALCMGHHIGLR